MYFTGKSNRLVLVHRQMEPVSSDEAIDIMLTPQFYTLKREPLPVKYAYQAKKIAPSLFEGLLESGISYDYFVYREEDAWIFIAYAMEEIVPFLISKGISPERVSRIFFAQQARAHLKTPLRLGDTEALVLLDETVVVVPQQALASPKWGHFDDSFRPAKGVKTDVRSQKILTRKQAVVLTVVLLCFALVWLVEGWRYGKKNTLLETKLTQLYEAYPALQSAYARESVAGKYRSIDKLERAKREAVGKVAGMLFKGVTLTQFTLEGKKLTAHFRTQDKQVAKKLKALVREAGFKMHAGTDGEIIVEGTV